MLTKKFGVLTFGVVAIMLLAVLVGCAAPAPTAAPAQPAAATQPPAPTTAPAAATQAPAPTTAPTQAASSGAGVTLTMGSWRGDDAKQMAVIFGKFHEKYPNITIKFEPTNPPDYNAALQTQLEGGKAPDLFYLRSFSISRTQYNGGFLELLDDTPGLKENFSPANREPWATDDGKSYGIPMIAVSHGIYYNQDVFKKLGLSEPKTWEDLLAASKKILDSGVTPFANGSGDEWTMAEIVFMNLAPNFIGGRDGRLQYLNGQRCLNDSHTVAAFQAIKDLAPYFPKNQSALKYYDSQQLWLQGQAAMWLGGSWDIPLFEQQKPSFAWSIFPAPPPAGQPGFVTFHLDAGMGLNSKSTHKAEAKQFLQWMTTPEFASLLENQLPGFFPIINNPPKIDDQYAQTFLSFNQGRGTDVRWAWPVLLDGQPDGYTLMQNGAIDVLAGKQTPQQAADALQAGVSKWLKAAQTCKK